MSQIRCLVLSLFALVTVTQVGCGESKVDQCNAVISSYNEVGAAVRQSFGDGTNADAVAAHAKGVEAAVGKLDKLSLGDAAVKSTRDALVVSFRQYATHVSEMAEVVRDSTDPAKADTIDTRLAAAQAGLEATTQGISAGKQQLAAACNTTFQ